MRWAIFDDGLFATENTENTEIAKREDYERVGTSNAISCIEISIPCFSPLGVLCVLGG